MPDIGEPLPENPLLNSGIRPEYADDPGWMPARSLRPPSSVHKRRSSTEPEPRQITIVYDPETSKGMLYLEGTIAGADKVLLQGDVVVGGKDHVTPLGVFHAARWEKDHTSKLYGWMANTPWSKSILGANAFGPFQLHIKELERRGIYIHGTMGPGWSSTTEVSGIAVSQTSHGCVRMSNLDIIKLRDLLPQPKGLPIKITTNASEAPK
jgi:hypothetical protein